MAFSCKTVHIALSPLAGAPIRLVHALNKHTQISARLMTANEYRDGRAFPHDLRWQVEEERETFLEELQAADIIHMHHWVDIEHNGLGINFAALMRRGKKIIRQFHSDPAFVAHHSGVELAAILNDPLPQLTILHFPERYLPQARLVPNIVPIDEAPFAHSRAVAGPAVSVYFRPSTQAGAWDERWATKGGPEVWAILRQAEQSLPDFHVAGGLDGVPYDENLRQRAFCSVCIDDVVTGSFHLTSLESLAQGLATICFVDARQLVTVTHFTGCNQLPFINFPLDELPVALTMLAKTPALAAEFGQQGRKWMERYWQPAAMVDHYVRIYEELLTKDPACFARSRFDDRDPAVRWMVREAEDLKWALRRKRFLAGVQPHRTA